jgi:hypothetical protein
LAGINGQELCRLGKADQSSYSLSFCRQMAADGHHQIDKFGSKYEYMERQKPSCWGERRAGPRVWLV